MGSLTYYHNELSGFYGKSGVGSNWTWGTRYSGNSSGGYVGYGSSGSAVAVFYVPIPTALKNKNATINYINFTIQLARCDGIASGQQLGSYMSASRASTDTPSGWMNSGPTPLGNYNLVYATTPTAAVNNFGNVTFNYSAKQFNLSAANTNGVYIYIASYPWNTQAMCQWNLSTTSRFSVTFNYTEPSVTTYKITYYKNDGSGTSSTPSDQSALTSGSSYTLKYLSQLGWSRSGYTFKGWGSSSSATSTSSAGTSKTCYGNTSWYAIWAQDAVQYTVKFYPGDHATVSNTSANAISRTYTEGGSLTLLSNTAFTGKSNYTSCTTKYYLQGGDVTSYNYPSSSSSYTRSGSSSNYCYSVEDNKRTDYSYEYWRGSDGYLRPCNVTYNSLKGNINMWPDWSGNVIFQAQFNPPNASRIGYRLSGWATSPTGTPNYQSGTNYQQSSNQNLYAIWEPNQVYINYYTDNDTAQPTDTIMQGPYDVGDTVRLSDGSGWTSSKWGSSVTFYTNYNFQGGSFSNGVTPNSTYSVSRTGKYDWVISGWLHGSQHYELQGWITLNSNIGIYPYWADSNSIVSHAAFTPITPIRKGYKFLNWNTQANGNGTAYYTNTNYNTSTIDKDLTLYAIWEPEWTIKINNGTNWGDYHVWIYTGATSNKGWQQAIPYVYDGSNWKLTKI